MGGMDNRTSIGLAKAKYRKRSSAIAATKLYEEYITSGAQFTLTFKEWQKAKRKKK